MSVLEIVGLVWLIPALVVLMAKTMDAAPQTLVGVRPHIGIVRVAAWPIYLGGYLTCKIRWGMSLECYARGGMFEVSMIVAFVAFVALGCIFAVAAPILYLVL